VQFAYNWFYRMLPVNKVNNDEHIYTLNDSETKAIKRNEKFAIWVAAFFGAMGVILLYVPQYVAPHWFPQYLFKLGSYSFNIPWAALIYTAVLVYIEILLLTFLNIYCIHNIAVATGFITATNKQDAEKRNLMLNVGLEKKDKALLKYGIDPLEGLNKQALIFWNILVTLKATLSNLAFKFIIQRILGRYAIKAVQDFAGIPIFAAWNAWGTYTVLKKARVVIMGQNLVQVLSQKIQLSHGTTSQFKTLLYDTVQYIAISKRDFHENHSVLTKNLFDIFNIPPQKEYKITGDYLQKIKAAPLPQQRICLLLIVVGFILDGNLSGREYNKIHELQNQKLLLLTDMQIDTYRKNFLNGKGLDELINMYI
jgi:hypothetical protein